MRPINPTLKNALNSPSVELFVAVELLFDSGPLRLWTGLEDKVIGGNTYTATGTLLGISGVEEASDLSAKGINLTLSGVDPQLVSIALQEPYQNRPVTVSLGSGNQTIQVFSGFMDVMTISDSGDTCEISISCESILITLDRITPLRYTQEIQQARYTGDTFFSYVADLADKTIVWGRSVDKPSGPDTQAILESMFGGPRNV